MSNRIPVASNRIDHPVWRLLAETLFADKRNLTREEWLKDYYVNETKDSFVECKRNVGEN